MIAHFRPHPFLIISICLFLSISTSSNACPTNETLRGHCRCESAVNGILLDCSSGSSIDPVDTPLILRILQENRAQLGLIQELQLRNGTLRQLNSRIFEGLYIKKLDLSENELENVSTDAFRGLENVLQTLILSKNQLIRFPASALSNMIALLQLDLSNNAIEDLQETDQLRNTPKLFDLNLANNRICNVHKQVFDDLKQSIQTLNLGGNCFDKVPAAAVRGFKQLLALHLHNNRIEQLEPLQFMNLPSLNLINLARNRIEAVHRQSFLNVPNLRFMYLSDNNITKLEGNEFRTFDNLELLDLTRNRIRTLPADGFVGMPRLSQLYLGENGIDTIEANAFANSSLIILLLPNNELTELRADMFNGLTYLQQFSLKENKISRVASNAFYQMPSLVVIDLSDNQLSTLEPATFLAQLNLFLLDLSRNKLTTTPHNAFNHRIVTVVLQDNPLVCTERVHVLQNGVGVNVPGTVDNVCNGGVASSPAPSIVASAAQATKTPSDTASAPDVPSFVQETLSTDTVLIIQQHTTPNSSITSGQNVQHVTKGQRPPASSISGIDRFPLAPPAGAVLPSLEGGNPNDAASNPGSENVGATDDSGGLIAGATSTNISPTVAATGANSKSGQDLTKKTNPNGNVGNGPSTVAILQTRAQNASGSTTDAQSAAIPNANAANPPFDIPAANGPTTGTLNFGPASNPNFFVPNFGSINNPHINPNLNAGPPLNTFDIGSIGNSQFPAPNPLGSVPEISRAPIGQSGKIDYLVPFGLTPQLTVVASDPGRRASPSPARPPVSVSSVPGIVEQVPLENEGQGGVVGVGNRPQNPAPPKTPEVEQGDIFDGQDPSLGQTPEFAWTWPVSPQIATRAPIGQFPFGPTLNKTFTTPEPSSDVITSALPERTDTPRSPPSQNVNPTTTRRPVQPWRGESGSSDVTAPPHESKTLPPPKKHRPDDELGGSDAAAAAGEVDGANANSSGANATTTIAVCLTVVVVVMISVFITLCIVRHRSNQNSRRSISSASRTSAYVAAQAARMNYAASTYSVVGPCSSSLGTGAYIRDASGTVGRSGHGGTLQRGASTAANNQAWIYAPGTYASPSTYYK